VENHGGDRGGDTDRRSEAGVGSTDGDELQHGPLEYLYKRFSAYIEDRRRRRQRVLGGESVGSLARTTDIRISEEHHGPADARRFQYVPTYILRGLTELHLEFTLTGETK
jgi:hypothetical protein